MRVAVVVTMSALVVACGGEEAVSTLTPPTVVDSAGVRVVTNRIPVQGLPEYAELPLQPEVEITGGTAGPLVDVERALTLPDGRIVVAARGSFEVRYYGPDGSFLLASGEEGNRMGTYRDLSRIGRHAGDSVWVWDVRSQRLTILDGEGEPAMDASAPAHHFVGGRFGDGSFFLVPGWRTDFHTRNPADTVRRDPAPYYRWFPGMGDTVRIGVFPHNEILVLEPEQANGLVVGTPPFGRQTVRAVGPGRLYVGDQETFEIRGYDPDGTLREILRLEGIDLTITPELLAAARRATDADADERPWAQRFWDAVPETRPAYGEIMLDALGHLWVGEHVAALTPARNWMVFAPDGALLGLVEVPPNFRVVEIGADYILGVQPGLPGAEVVRRYALNRRGTRR